MRRDMSAEHLIALWTARPLSLSEPVPGTDGMTYEERLPDSGPSPLDLAIQAERRDLIPHFMSRYLTPRQEQVLRMRFGIGESERLSLKEIGQRLGYSREWVRQTELMAKAKLGRALSVFLGLPLPEGMKRDAPFYCRGCKQFVPLSGWGDDQFCLKCMEVPRKYRYDRRTGASTTYIPESAKAAV